MGDRVADELLYRKTINTIASQKNVPNHVAWQTTGRSKGVCATVSKIMIDNFYNITKHCMSTVISTALPIMSISMMRTDCINKEYKE